MFGVVLPTPFLGLWGRDRAAAVAIIQRLSYRELLHVEACRLTDAIVEADKTVRPRRFQFPQFKKLAILVVCVWLISGWNELFI